MAPGALLPQAHLLEHNAFLIHLACAPMSRQKRSDHPWHMTNLWVHLRNVMCIFAGNKRKFRSVLNASCKSKHIFKMVNGFCGCWAQEKNAFEFAAHLHIPHSPEAVGTSLAS